METEFTTKKEISPMYMVEVQFVNGMMNSWRCDRISIQNDSIVLLFAPGEIVLMQKNILWYSKTIIDGVSLND